MANPLGIGRPEGLDLVTTVSRRSSVNGFQQEIKICIFIIINSCALDSCFLEQVFTQRNSVVHQT